MTLAPNVIGVQYLFNTKASLVALSVYKPVYMWICSAGFGGEPAGCPSPKF